MKRNVLLVFGMVCLIAICTTISNANSDYIYGPKDADKRVTDIEKAFLAIDCIEQPPFKAAYKDWSSYVELLAKERVSKTRADLADDLYFKDVCKNLDSQADFVKDLKVMCQTCKNTGSCDPLERTENGSRSKNSGTYKAGWSEGTIEVATLGCVTALMRPTIEKYKQKAQYKGDDIPPELEKVLPTLRKEMDTFCGCIFEIIATSYSYTESRQLAPDGTPKMQQFSIDVIESGKCKLPFNLE